MSIYSCEHMIKDIYLVLSCTRHIDKITVNLKGRHSDCFVYVLSGKTEYTFTDGLHLQVQANDLLYLAKDSRYVMDITEEPYDVIYVDFDFDVSNFDNSCVFRIKHFADLKNAFYSLRRKWITKNSGYRSECLSKLYKIYAIAIQSQNAPYLPKSKQSALNNAINEIADNFSDSALSIKSLANLSNMSEGHFRRIFKTVYSVSPIQYVNSVRIEHAKKLLLQDFSIAEISEQSGFTSPYYFCKRFKAETGISPTQYRKEHRNQI